MRLGNRGRGIDNDTVKVLARAFRWQRMLDEGVCGTIEELASREKVNRGYMSRVLRLTLLAPDIVEAILDGRQPEGLRLEDLLDGLPVEWQEQRREFRLKEGAGSSSTPDVGVEQGTARR